MTDNFPPTPRPRRLQFSLRLLLLAFTTFALGFPIWYRWPYEEITWRSPPGSRNPAHLITTWQRQWGGGKLKHGLQRLIRNGKTEESVPFRNGLRHGTYIGPNVRGEFVNDLKEGVWTGPDRTSTWRQGKLHGPYELQLPPTNWPPRIRARLPADKASDQPRTVHLLFADGRLTQIDGQPASSRLFDLVEADVIDNRIRNELYKSTTLDVIEMPLTDTILYLTEVHNIPIIIDPLFVPNSDMPITEQFNGLDLASVLMLITAPRGLDCDFRYGSLWITTADDAEDWHDPTGVSEIKPPSDSALARVWNESAAIGAANVSLASALDFFQERLAIHIDTTQVQPTAAQPVPFPVTANLKGIPFRHLLGQLLYQTHCRCHLEGETLVILPPDNHE